MTSDGMTTPLMWARPDAERVPSVSGGPGPRNGISREVAAVLIRLAAVLVALGLVTGGASVQNMGPDRALAATDPTVVGTPGIGDPYFPEDGNGGIDVLSYEIHDAYRFTGRVSGWTRLTLRTTERL